MQETGVDVNRLNFINLDFSKLTNTIQDVSIKIEKQGQETIKALEFTGYILMILIILHVILILLMVIKLIRG